MRNNQYIFTKDYTDDAAERVFEYQDEAMPPAFYYVRVTQAPGEWAWSSPIWVDPPVKAAGQARNLLIFGGIAAGVFLVGKRRSRAS